MILAQVPLYVIYVDDSVIDDNAEGDYQPCQNHNIERRSPQVEHVQGRQQRQRDRHQANQRCPPAIEKDTEHQNHEQRSDDRCPGEIGDRHLDEGRRAEERGVKIDAGKSWPQRIQRILYPTRHLQGVHVG